MSESVPNHSYQEQENLLKDNSVGRDLTFAPVQIINYYYREEARLVPSDSTDAADEYLPCPYRGLFHFGPNDADVFFGREIFIEELYSATKTKNFIPVLGASGSGKSSVVLAGLVPKLQKAGHWQFTHFRPGFDPFHALALALVPLYTPKLDQTDQIAQARKMAGYLQDGSVILLDVFAKIQQNHPNHRVLLIADQFEEIYTLCNNQEIRLKFLDCLLASLVTPTSLTSSATVLVTTMRADFLGNALSYRPFADVLQNGDVKLGPMNREELTQVIEKPAQKFGVTFADGLVERILDDVENQPGNLPLLEFALTELWNKRSGKQLTHKIYEEIGQVEGALARHADEKYGNLTDDEKQKVRRIFIQLVRPGEGAEDTRRIAMKAELGEQSWSLVKQLADARLVVTSRNATSQETVEVVHEALIRNWGELREWMNTNRVFRAWQERLRSAKGQWEATKRDPGSLLRGAALAEAEEKLKERPEDLIDEKEFIEQSIQERYRGEKEKEEQQQRERLIEGLTMIGHLLPIKPVDALVQAIQSIGLNLALVQSSGNILDSVKQGLDLATKSAREQNVFKGHKDGLTCVAVSPDGNLIASSSKDGTVRLWDTQGNPIGKPIQEHQGSVCAVAFSPDGTFIASGGQDGAVLFCNTQGNLIGQLFPKKHKKKVSWQPVILLLKLCLSNLQSNWIITIYSLVLPSIGYGYYAYGIFYFASIYIKNKMILNSFYFVWMVLTLVVSICWFSPWFKMKGAVTSVAFSPDGKYIITGHEDKKVRLWDKQDKLICMPFQGHQGSVTSVSFSPDSKQIVSTGQDLTFQLWNLRGMPKKSSFKFSWDFRIIIELYWTFIRDIFARMYFFPFWLVFRYFYPPKTQIGQLFRHQDAVTSVAFSPDGQYIVSGSRDNKVRLWNKQGKLIGEPFKGHENDVTSVAFSRDGQYIVSGSRDRTVRLWDNKGNPIGEPFKGHENDVTSVAFSPDGQYIVSSSSDTTVRLWDIRNHDCENWQDYLQVACNRLRYHPIFKNPETDIAKKACEFCIERRSRFGQT
ncbi:MAG: eIF2A-related protein [Nostoc sp. EfeVER01]|uniref:nSTAND1 domain-containing NTPase n=1 Tax=unclassified Nostoc TaxID=2593658 RepID=UPI002AD50402|nr:MULTISPECIES: hypothetical protein [unclassified Nostoc]MDZ7943928.1 hypothetical protein [Nostoc sp. EfeVER01]MDZ7992280.1 hypothetical protein [Nostoc sp. EspVER01]